jgi:hypothetical protein
MTSSQHASALEQVRIVARRAAQQADRRYGRRAQALGPTGLLLAEVEKRQSPVGRARQQLGEKPTGLERHVYATWAVDNDQVLSGRLSCLRRAAPAVHHTSAAAARRPLSRSCLPGEVKPEFVLASRPCPLPV